MFVLSFWTLCSFWTPPASLYFYFFVVFSQQGSHIYQKRTFRGTERDVVQQTASLSHSLPLALGCALSLSLSHSPSLTAAHLSHTSKVPSCTFNVSAAKLSHDPLWAISFFFFSSLFCLLLHPFFFLLICLKGFQCWVQLALVVPNTG